ncbi:transposase IS200 [Meiothermus ruber DSM 1279]|jgi:putative transposase|uniref:Transposase IS200 n=2 Tax=Meiothermus ruber TaxID=277 RepID=D3PKU3_MEIRD|nr:transposase [Meiothermus ruber]ADD28967.1 transposase IS200 [Meiothermus ruber DSM 1279]AGK05583.1 transposase IS200 [Meiothermus ruber DSM 1279]MCX7740181.1 transposase [Meiothermus sp.]
MDSPTSAGDRRHVFVGEVRERLMQVFRETCLMRDWIVLGLEVMPDHAHLFVSVPPKWSPSFYVGSAGNISAQTIQRYIELQRKHQVDEDA